MGKTIEVFTTLKSVLKTIFERFTVIKTDNILLLMKTQLYNISSTPIAKQMPACKHHKKQNLFISSCDHRLLVFDKKLF